MANEEEREQSAAGEHTNDESAQKGPDRVPDEARDDVAERPGSGATDHQHADKLVDEWTDESFPGSDPPAHY